MMYEPFKMSLKEQIYDVWLLSPSLLFSAGVNQKWFSAARLCQALQETRAVQYITDTCLERDSNSYLFSMSWKKLDNSSPCHFLFSSDLKIEKSQ